MQLQRGVVLYEETECGLSNRPRLMLSSGMRRAAETKLSSEYCNSAIIPEGPWLPITDERLKGHFSPNLAPAPGSWISIVKVPDQILELFRPLQEASRAQQTADYINRNIVGESEQIQVGLMAALDFCAEFNQLGECFVEGMGIRANAPGLSTVTSNKQNDCLIGLHLDSWFRAPVKERHLSPNRICINLGVEDRYLVFINLPLRRMAEYIASADSPNTPASKHDTDLLNPFQYLFPDYPVTRLRVCPGEAYIAPTENIIHDGSTADHTTADIQLTVLGRFEPRRVMRSPATDRNS